MTRLASLRRGVVVWQTRRARGGADAQAGVAERVSIGLTPTRQGIRDSWARTTHQTKGRYLRGTVRWLGHIARPAIHEPRRSAADAAVGGLLTYTVGQTIPGTNGLFAAATQSFDPGSILFFAGAQTVGEMFLVLSTVAGNPYEVSFDVAEGPSLNSVHGMTVSALDGSGLGGTSSAPPLSSIPPPPLPAASRSRRSAASAPSGCAVRPLISGRTSTCPSTIS